MLAKTHMQKIRNLKLQAYTKSYYNFNKEATCKALTHKGEPLEHPWQKYNAISIVDGKKPMSYRQYYRWYSEWADSK